MQLVSNKAPTLGKGFNLRDHVWVLVYCAFFSLGAFLFGYDNSYYTGIQAMQAYIDKFGDLTHADGSRSFSASMLSILTSIIQVGDLIGAVCSGIVGFYWGRKGVAIVANVLVIVGIVLQAASPDNGTFIGGRIILGLAVGLLSGSVPIYLCDVTPIEIRGMVVGSWQLVLTIGGIVGSGIDKGTEGIDGPAAYEIPICFQLIIPVIMLTFIWFVPESPRYLISKDRHESARSALVKLNRSQKKNYDPTEDLRVIISDEEAERAAPRGSWLELFADPIERRKLFCCAGAFFAQQFTGTTFIATYGTVFARDLGIADPFTIGMIQNVGGFVGVICSWTIVERFGRRTVLLCTTSVMICMMATVGGLACGPQAAFLVPEAAYGKAIVSLTVIYVTIFNAAWGPLAWTIAAEMAVGRNRPRLMGAGVGFFWFFSWLITFTLPYLFTTARLGAKIGFIYAGTATCSLLFVYFFLGETRGRTLEEIDELFRERVPARKWSSYTTSLAAEALTVAEKVSIGDKDVVTSAVSV